MSMPVKIVNYAPLLMVGLSINMSYQNNKTFELWNGFMSRRKELKHTVQPNLYSIQQYPLSFMESGFNPTTEFTKWACIETKSIEDMPNEFKSFNFEGGLYAVFSHKGDQEQFIKHWQWIFNSWLPQSCYVLDHRIHFEILGPHYKQNSSDSEECICIPIKLKF